MIPDEGLLAEVSGLAEWPVVYVGTIQDEFMDVPAEILQTSMRTHQKYFSLRDPKTGKMANRFALVANMIAKDGGKEIVAGNERVLRARLSDAKFFWDEDRTHTLESRVEKLKNIVFHAKLGSQYERVRRIVVLAGAIAATVGTEVDAAKARRAARFSKADLTSGVVGEFPELQGIMGRYYALHEKEDGSVADAIRDHYRPVGPNDLVPEAPASIAVALADKADMLVGFFAAGEKPTGSGDPFALRRAALGIIRLILSNSVRLNLSDLFTFALLNIVKLHDEARLSVIETLLENPNSNNLPEVADNLSAFFRTTVWRGIFEDTVQPEQFKAAARSGNVALNYGDAQVGGFLDSAQEFVKLYSSIVWLHDADEEKRAEYAESIEKNDAAAIQLFSNVLGDVWIFMADRLKVALKEKGVRHDLIDAVFSLGNEDDLVRLVARVEALQAFLKSDDGANLLAGYKRAANILKAEEKKDSKTFISEVSESLLSEAAEKALFTALALAKTAIAPLLEKEDFAAAMQQMAALRVPVDAFFDGVKVNSDDKQIRENRLNLLAALRATLHQVADFSKIEG
jgi:glycyl-tRNA synthetase beta chain